MAPRTNLFDTQNIRNLYFYSFHKINLKNSLKLTDGASYCGALQWFHPYKATVRYSRTLFDNVEVFHSKTVTIKCFFSFSF